MAFGYEWRLISSTKFVEPYTLGVAECGKTVTITTTIKGDYEMTVLTIAKYVPLIGQAFTAGYHIGAAFQFEKKEINVSHSCTGGPEFKKLIIANIKMVEEKWELWSTGPWDALIAKVTSKNPDKIHSLTCPNWIPCSE